MDVINVQQRRQFPLPEHRIQAERRTVVRLDESGNRPLGPMVREIRT